jgi:hypothetical protein
MKQKNKENIETMDMSSRNIVWNIEKKSLWFWCMVAECVLKIKSLIHGQFIFVNEKHIQNNQRKKLVMLLY